MLRQRCAAADHTRTLAHADFANVCLKQPVNFSQRRAAAVAPETSDRWLGPAAVADFSECSGEIPTNAAGSDCQIKYLFL